jgi:acetyltransferase-like isoleucine patch superfamily enzyme
VSFLRRILDRSIAGVKADDGYRIDPRMTTMQLLTVLWYRGAQALRGLTFSVRAPHVERPVFRGRRTVVEHAFQLRAGPGLILEDDVYVNALSRDGVTLGRNVTIARGSSIVCTGVITQLGVGIVIGDRCAIGAGSFLGGQGGIRIGSDVIAGAGVRIFSENHVFDDPARSIRSQGVIRKGVVIADDCWIGAGATIVDGVTIGRGCVIGAGSVVTRDAPEFAVLAGAPARVIGLRSSESAEGGRQGFPPTTTDSRGKIRSSGETESAAYQVPR